MALPAVKYSREALKNEYWYRGKLYYKFKPIQKRLYEAYNACRSFLFVSLIARQTGKSFHWAALSIETCLRKPCARIRYGTAFQSDLEEFIIPVFDTLFQDCPEDLRPKYDKIRAKYKFKNGSEIKLVGLDKHPDGLRGNALDLVILDEAGFVSKLRYTFTSIILPMLRSRPHLRVIMSSTPSETPDHEFTEFVHEAAEEGNLFKATIDDDETVTEEVKERLIKECGGKESTTYRREFLVEFVTESDLAIIPEWDDSFISVVPPDEFISYYHRYSAMDLGVTDFTAGIFGYYHFRKASLVILAETGMRGPEMTTDKLALQLSTKEKELWGEQKVYRRIADNNNPLLCQDLSILHKIHFIPTSKDELPAMINEVRLLVKQGRLLVHPDCKMLLGCLKYGIYNDRKEKREFARSKVYGHYDWLAALVYMVRNLDTRTNPIPIDYNVAEHSHFIRHDRMEAAKQQHQAWAGILGKKFVKRGGLHG